MKKIVVIEDDINARESIVDILQMENYDVYSADNGKSGLDILKSLKPDLILCDIAMPKMNGYEVYSAIQTDANLALVPFIYLTARAEKEDIKFGLRLGVDDYITKPLNFDELLSTISRRLDKRERIVKETEEKYKSIFESSITGIFIYSEQSISYANHKFLSMLGYDDINEINIINLFESSEQKEVLSKLNSCLVGTIKNVLIHTKMITQTQEIKPIQLYASHTIREGKHSVVVMVQEADVFDSLDLISKIDKINNIALIVSSRETIRTTVIKSMLAGDVVDIIEFKNDFSFIKALEHNDYDLVISDIDMIGTDGKNLVKEIRKIQSYRNTPIIAISTPFNI